jgi:integrase
MTKPKNLHGLSGHSENDPRVRVPPPASPAKETAGTSAQRRRRPQNTNRLSEAKIAKLTKNKRYPDGGNLWLQVTGNGAGKSWIFRWTEPGTGRDRNMGLGPLDTISLDEARELAKFYRQVLIDGDDPQVERDRARGDDKIARGLAKTFNQVADEYFEAKIAHLSPSYRRTTIRQLAHVRDAKAISVSLEGKEPIRVGEMPIQKINTNMILEDCGLRVMWKSRHTEAEMTLNHLQRLFDFAIAKGYIRRGKNPASWKENLKYILPPRYQMHHVEHHKECPYQDAPKLAQVLRAYKDRSSRQRGRSMTAIALEFALLVGGRGGEVRKATWGEFDLKRMVWTVPWQHLKKGTVHRTPKPVPITGAMLKVIEQVQKRWAIDTDARIGRPADQPPADALVFPSTRNKVIADGEFGRFLTETIGGRGRDPALALWPPAANINPHGFRSTLRSWMRAKTSYRDELWKITTDQRINENRTDDAYGHDKLLEKRRGMMEEWDAYLHEPAPEPKETGNIVNLTDRRSA